MGPGIEKLNQPGPGLKILGPDGLYPGKVSCPIGRVWSWSNWSQQVDEFIEEILEAWSKISSVISK